MCREQLINDAFLAMLEELRLEYGETVVVTSGYRCALRQEQLRKQGYETAVGISSHEMGIAADVAPKLPTPENMVRLHAAALKVFAKHSVGTARSFLHVDARPGGPRRWSYKNA